MAKCLLLTLVLRCLVQNIKPRDTFGIYTVLGLGPDLEAAFAIIASNVTQNFRYMQSVLELAVRVRDRVGSRVSVKKK